MDTAPAAPVSTDASTNLVAAVEAKPAPMGSPESLQSLTNGQVKPTPPPPEEIFDVKVNGRNVRMTRQEAIDRASMSYAANERFTEAKKIRGEVDRIIATAKSNPIKALMDPSLGLTKDQIRDSFEKWYNSEYIEPEQLSPEQRRIRELETQNKTFQEESEARKIKEQEEHEEKLTNQEREFLQQEIITALNESGLPKTAYFAQRMAFYMRQNLRNGWQAPTEMIVRQVQREHSQIFSDIIQNSSPQELIKLVPDLVKKIRRHDLQELRAKRGMSPPDFRELTEQPTDEATQPNHDPRDGNHVRTGRVDTTIYYDEVNRRMRNMMK